MNAVSLTKSSLSLDIYLTLVVLTSATIQKLKDSRKILVQEVSGIQIE
jgi:hypothetical protein